MEHLPVLLEDVLRLSSEESHSPKFLFDGTFGRGGHTRALLEKYSNMKVVAFDQDQAAIDYAHEAFADEISSGRLLLIRENFINIESKQSEIKKFTGGENFDMILLDLGVSSPQLDQAERGFSFYNDGPLDMRMDQRGELTAQEIINTYDRDELRDLFYHYGEVRRPGRVVDRILERREHQPFKSTVDLSSLIEKAEGWARKGHHPATNYFLALRLKVNEELKVVEDALPIMFDWLAPDGRLLLISFHSLEDRLAKEFYKGQKAKGLATLINKKVVQATWQAKKENPRARSAKLRVLQRSNT